MSIPLINENYKPLVYTALTATGLATAALFAPLEAIRIVGMTVLTGIGYGITNDMIGCRDCIEYFTIGHFYDELSLENRPLNTLDPTLNAMAWGAIATWHVCAIAGAALALIARLPFFGLALKITAVQLAPYLLIGAAVTIIIAHGLSRWAQSKMAQEPYLKYEGVPLELQAGWEACNVRNSTGYAALGIGGTILAVAMIAARAGLIPL
ncbi:MAG: hypothetical protein K1X28_09105 [Parachlamydiales bacterium]|nr:hypothetical protein [Parachlamydiales bacterium]